MSKLVKGYGPLDCKIAIIGEAPGVHESLQGRPFVGPAGQLLDQLLPKAGIVRQACYIDNVVQVQPPNNDITVFLDASKKAVKKTKEYTDGVESLRESLSKSSANVFVALGNTPLYALCNKTGISNWRGSILESTLLPGRKVIPTIHPAAALREYIFQRIIIADLIRANRESAFPEIRRPEYSITTFPSYDDSVRYLNSVLYNHSSVAVDIEVVGREVKCIAFATDPQHAFCIPFTSDGKDYFDPYQEADIWVLVGRILESPSITKIFQNGMFDLTFIYERYGIVPQNLDDTMIAHAILYPDYRHGLDFITSTYTDMPYYKDEGKQWNKLFMDEKQFFEYNGRDVIACSVAMPKLLADLEKQGNLETYRRQLSLTRPLMYVQSKGIRLDHEGIEKAKTTTAQEIKDLTAKLHEIAGFELNPQSPKQLQTYFYIKKGYPTYTFRGRPTTDETAMKRLARRGAPEANIILEIRGRAKMLGTYLDVDLDDDKRMRGAFRLMTANGRVSSGKTIFGTGGNLQNQPPEMSKYFLADEGMVIYALDMSQAENRIVAVVAQETAMIHAFETGQDVHALTGALISGLTVEEVTRQHKAGEWCSVGSGTMTWRDWGKRCNHGLNYGLGYKKFALMFEIQEVEAKRLVEAYHHAYPNVRYGFHEFVQHQLKQNRTLTNPYGRKRLFLDRWGEELFKEAYAFIPQSTVPDKMWEDGVVPVYEDQERYREVSLMNTVHDSLVFQVPLTLPWERHADILTSIVARLEKPIPWRSTQITIPCDVKMGFNLGETVKLPHKLNEPFTAEYLWSAREKLNA